MSGSDKVLVVGGAGVIGHYVVRALLAHKLTPIVLSFSGNLGFLSDIADRITVVRGDMTDRAGLATILAAHRPFGIAHLGAALENVTEVDPPAGIRLGIEGVVNVFAAACDAGVRRVVYASSKSAYGPIGDPYEHPTYAPMPEDAPLRPASVYGIAKLACEQIGTWYAANRGLEFAALRFGSTVGPGKLQKHGGTSLHSLILESAMAGKPVAIEKGGEAKTDIVYNADIAAGFIGALLAPTLKHDIYNIASGAGFTLRDYAAAVRRRFPKAAISIGPGHRYLPPMTGHCIFDISRARRDFGYAPAFADFDRMVGDYLAMMKTLGLEPAAR